jgi:hypothetical protein
VLYFFAGWAISIVIKVRNPLGFGAKATPSAANAGSPFDPASSRLCCRLRFRRPSRRGLGSFLAATVIRALIWLVRWLLPAAADPSVIGQRW